MSGLTVKILQEIRDDIRGLREDNRTLHEDNRTLRADMDARFGEVIAHSNTRFEVIETTLRDLAQQMVMLSRAIKVALDQRPANDERFADHERRIAELERSTHGR